MNGIPTLFLVTGGMIALLFFVVYASQRHDLNSIQDGTVGILPLMSADKLQSMPKGSFVVMKMGTHLTKTNLKLFSSGESNLENTCKCPTRAAVRYTTPEK